MTESSIAGYITSMGIRRWSCCLAMLTALGACNSTDPILADRCFILVAEVAPAGPRLQIGDTVTMHATFYHNVAPACLPPDTTAAGLRWISGTPAIVAVDSGLGRLTAVRPGVTQIMVVPAGSGGVLGTTFASVLEPPSADSLISLIQNNTPDSATVVLEDAGGAIVRSVTLASARSMCWNTALSDSVRYRASLYLSGQPSATPIGSKWVVHSALSVSHTWRVAIDPQGSALPTLDLAGLSPDRGC